MQRTIAGVIQRVGIAACALVGIAALTPAHAQTSNDCKPADGARFICGAV